ncbi:ATP synthase subunit I [Thermodesulforhabdus norvegica]|uniref:ATP synthase I chain n=1 Tax=Thermodesulforhabdus norvegica TaxID=39841 RepID=A0A1I4RJ82_9BACT|nr:ATP synthase subunit I [Thermodesulforhabdus norvegica]SFM52362.1 ATP synthase I chain [Thermodesulforhabdus norvegica]
MIDDEIEQGVVEFRRAYRRMSRRFFSGIVLLGLVIFMLGYKAVARGLVLGGLFSVINFNLMAHFLPYQLGVARARASVIAFASLLGRLLLLSIPIVVALKWDNFNAVATIVGLFAVPVGLFIEKVFLGRLCQHS